MRTLILLFILATATSSIQASTSSDDPCRAKAIAAAQDAYGLDPFRTTISTVVEGQSYKVTTGIGNPEAGEDVYNVTFANGCGSPAVAVEAPEVPINALQADADAVFSKLVSYNRDIPSSDEVAASELPAKAQTLYVDRVKTLEALCTQWIPLDGKNPDLSVSVYKVEVDGQDVFAVWMPNEHDSIRAYVYLVDVQGGDIDQAAVYSDASVGQNGVTWQNESVRK